MSFSESFIERAWERQGGRCAGCGISLRLCRWDAHHRKAVQFGGSDTLRNCVLLCEGTYNDCHLQLGHDGDWRENTVLYDEDLPFLYAGEEGL